MARHWDRSEFRVVAIPPRQITVDALGRLKEQGAAGGLSIETTEHLVVEAIRKCADAKEQSVVGKDCMAVLLDPPSVRVRFLPVATQMAEVTGGASTKGVPAAFSPWVVTPSIQCPPAIMGGWEVHTGNVTIAFDAPALPPDTSVKFALSAQLKRESP